MKKVLFSFILFLLPFVLYAQTDSIDFKKPTYSVRHGFVPEVNVRTAKAKEFGQKHLYLAGVSMRKAANYQYCSIGASLIGGTLFVVGGTSNDKGARTGLFVGGGIMTLASLGCWLTSIHFHDKAGRELQISAGEVIYRF